MPGKCHIIEEISNLRHEKRVFGESRATKSTGQRNIQELSRSKRWAWNGAETNEIEKPCAAEPKTCPEFIEELTSAVQTKACDDFDIGKLPQ